MLNINNSASAIAKPIIQPFVVPRPSTIELILSVTVASVWPGSRTGASPAPAIFCEPSGSTNAPHCWIWFIDACETSRRGIEWVSERQFSDFSDKPACQEFTIRQDEAQRPTLIFLPRCNSGVLLGRDRIKPKAT